MNTKQQENTVYTWCKKRLGEDTARIVEMTIPQEFFGIKYFSSLEVISKFYSEHKSSVWSTVLDSWEPDPDEAAIQTASVIAVINQSVFQNTPVSTPEGFKALMVFLAVQKCCRDIEVLNGPPVVNELSGIVEEAVEDDE